VAGFNLSPNNDSSVLAVSVVNSSSSTVTATAAVPNQIIRIYKLFLVSGGTSNWTFLNGSTAISGAIPMVVNGSVTLDMDGTPWFTTSVNAAFAITNSGSTSINGCVYYTAANF